MSLCRRLLCVLSLTAAASCVGGPISDLPHSGDDEGGGPRPPTPTGPGLDAGAAGRMDAGVPSGNDFADADASPDGGGAADACQPHSEPDDP